MHVAPDLIPPDTDALSRMERDWDARAREAAEYYIATGQREWSPEAFFEGGRINVENEILSDEAITERGRLLSRMRAIEIGCGSGRMTRAMAGVFGEVHAVDISAEMIARARKNLAGFPNVHLYKGSGADLPGLPDRSFDFAFSFIVFQHIPSLEVIESYVREVHRCLKPGGLFKFQVQGDVSIRSAEKDSWLGAQITVSEAAELAQRCGFKMVRSSGFGTQYAWLWFEKPGRFHFPRLRLWPRKRASVEFSRETVQPGETYTVKIPRLAGCRIDIGYEFFGEPDAAPVSGVVSHWCELDNQGEARISVPADHLSGQVRITRVRSRAGDGRWHRVNAVIRVARKLNLPS
jgi:ubiquinone/menaquinone biosynthesis C-methylase UbiE